MLGWMAGFRQDFMISVGKGNKYLMKYLTEQEQAALLKTYSRADIKEAWEALWQMCGFFAQISSEAAKQMGFSVNLKEEKGSLAYIRKLFTEQEDFPCGVDFETGQLCIRDSHGGRSGRRERRGCGKGQDGGNHE